MDPCCLIKMENIRKPHHIEYEVKSNCNTLSLINTYKNHIGTFALTNSYSHLLVRRMRTHTHPHTQLHTESEKQWKEKAKRANEWRQNKA